MASLYEKIFGCIAASRIASAMAVPTEGMDEDQIEAKFGRLEGFLTVPRHVKAEEHIAWPSLKKLARHEFDYQPGETEDGIERQKLLCTAIIEKKRRITVEDWAEIINRDVIPEKHFGYLMWIGDEYLYPMVQGGVPPCYAGIFFPWPGVHGFTRACHPIGIVNAGNPWQAARDALDVGMLMYPRYGTGIWSAASYAAAIAEAMKKDSSIDSVINAAVEHGGESMANAITWMLRFAEDYRDVFELRKPLNDHYRRSSMSGEENVSKALVIFKMTNADPRASIIAGVNFGRDTDCVAAMAAGLSGAFTGRGNIPQEWIDRVDEVTKQSQRTVSNISIDETARGLLEAVKANIESLKRQIASLEI